MVHDAHRHKKHRMTYIVSSLLFRSLSKVGTVCSSLISFRIAALSKNSSRLLQSEMYLPSF